MLLSDYILQTQELVHDISGIDYTTSELTNYINNARKRVALDFHCVRTLYRPLTTIVNQEQYPITGGCGGATVTAGGTYVAPPTVTFSAPTSGVTATGTPVMSGTTPNLTVASVAMTNWGSGYTAVPTVTFSAGTVTATGNATSTTMLNVIDILDISVLFGNLRTQLLWRDFRRFQAIMRSNTSIGGQPVCYSDFKEMNTFFLYPALPDQNYTMEIDAVQAPTPLVNPTDVDLQVVDPMADCVQFYAAWLALLKLQNFKQAEYMFGKYSQRMKQVWITRQGARVQNIYQNVWRREQRGF